MRMQTPSHQRKGSAHEEGEEGRDRFEEEGAQEASCTASKSFQILAPNLAIQHRLITSEGLGVPFKGGRAAVAWK